MNTEYLSQLVPTFDSIGYSIGVESGGKFLRVVPPKGDPVDNTLVVVQF